MRLKHLTAPLWRAGVVLLGLLGSGAQAYTVTCTKVYASSWNSTTGNPLNDLYELSGATMTSVYTAPQFLGGLAISANGSAYYDGGGFTAPTLYRYNGTTQTNTNRTLPNLNVGEAADSSGNVYYIDTAYHLRKVVAGGTGAASDLGALVFDAGDTIGPALKYGDMTFDGNGRLMWYSSLNNGAGASYLYAVDPSTLKAKSLGRVGPDGATGLAFDSSGQLITTTAAGATVVSVNLGASSLAGTTIGTASTPVYDLGSCAQPILNASLNVVKTAANITRGTNPATIAEAGDVLEYTITTTNTGNLPSTDSVLTDAIPAGTTYVANSTTLNGTAVADVSGAMPFVAGKEVYTATQPSGVILAGASNAAVVKFRVTLNASGLPTSVTNTANMAYPTVSGGVSTTQKVSGTVSTPTAPDLTVTKTHVGTWTQGDAGRTYSITVTNSGTAPTTSAVSVTDTLPAGLSATSISGTGWTCTLGTLTCTRSDALAAGSSYPVITVVVKVSATAPASVTNSVTVSGGGELKTSNDTASDPTTIQPGAFITLQKTTRGAAGGPFTFALTNAAQSTGTVSTSAAATPTQVDGDTGTAGTQTFQASVLGTAVTIGENSLPAGWVLNAANTVCKDASNAVVGSLSGATYTIPASAITSGAAITCTFTNDKLPTLTVTKISNGGTGTFTFTGTNGWASQNVTTVSAGGSGTAGATQTLGSVGAATTITESAPPAGWVLASATCTNLGAGGTVTPTVSGASGGSVTLDSAATAPGANITCTFTNNKLATLNLVKVSTTNTTAFNFSVTGMPTTATGSPNASIVPAFQLNPTTAAGNGYSATQTYTNVTPGVGISLSELASAASVGYSLASIQCSDATGAPTGSTSSKSLNPAAGIGAALGTVTATLVPGANVTCTFTNIKNPKIVLTKQVIGADGTFTFTQGSSLAGSSIAPASPSITTSSGTGFVNSTVSGLLLTDTTNVTITEAAAAGYFLTAVSCTDLITGTPLTGSATATAPGATVNLGSRQVVLSGVTPNDEVNCTFTNAQVPTVTIRKSSVGATGTFTFGSGTNGLPASASVGTAATNPATLGTYALTALNTSTSITETIPSGWVLASVACVDASNTAVSVTANLGTGQLTIPAAAITAGAALTCTFTNTVANGITLDKTWVNGLTGDAVSLTIGGASGATAGSSTPASTTAATATGLSGATITVTEAFTAGTSSNYSAPTLQCARTDTNATLTLSPISTYSQSFTMPSAPVKCTYTNTRRQASVTLRKAWVNGRTGDSVTLGITGGAAALGGSATLGGVSTDATATGYAGDTLTFTETFTSGSAANYNATLSCTGALDTTPGNGLKVDPADTNIICTYTNSRVAQQLRLSKTWGAGSGSANSITVTTTGSANSATLTSTASAGTTTGSFVTVYAGDVVTLPAETFTNGSAGTYTSTVACSGGTTLASTGVGSGQTITISSNTPDTTCTYTNAPNPGTLTVTKTISGATSTTNLSFPFSVTCQTPTATYTGTVTVNAGATTGSATLSGLPAGSSSCVITEGALPTPPVNYAWGAPTYTQPSGTLAPGGTLSGSIDNPLVLGTAVLSVTKVTPTTFVKYLRQADGTFAPSPASITYTVTVGSASSTALNVTVTDTLPANLTNVTVKGSRGDTITTLAGPTTAGQTLSWSAGDISAGTSTTYTVTVTLPSVSAQNQAAIQNSASAVGSNAAATTPSTATTQVVFTDLFKQVHNIGKAPASSPVPLPSPAWGSASTGLPGEVLEYCINFTNYGSVALPNYVVSDVVPVNTTVVPNSWAVNQGPMTATPVTPLSGAAVTYSAGTVSASVGTLNPGSTGSLCFRATIN